MSALATEPTTVTKKPTSARATAETLAAKQRDISVSEFFAKNRHLLGFDNPRKALLTTVKEAVDNSLDACEEAGILPDITVVIEDLQPDRPASAKSSRYRVTVVDNGPGIVRKQVENVFGRLLFGSKFHRLKMSRGQQGIGISAAGMYGLITTGKPMLIQTRPKAEQRAHHIELAMNTKTNRAEVTVDEETDDFPLARLRELSPAVRDIAARGEYLSRREYPTGTCVSIELEGKYQRGRGSVDEFLELTAIANPHAKLTFVRPTRETAEDDEPNLVRGRAKAPEPADAAPAAPAPEVTTDLGDLVIFPRAVSELPPETQEIQPHPKGVELGTLLQMLKDYQEATKDSGTLYKFLQERFCRVSASTASEFCEKIGVTSRTKVPDIEPQQAQELYKAFQDAKLAPPPTDCLAPIGVQQLLKGMFKGVRAEFYAASSREADVYRGRPFLIETAIAFGGELPGDDSARVIRFANRVPLLFQQSACSSFKAVVETNWRNYDLQHPRAGLPVGPLVIMIHMASVWVPFTSESKEAIADYDEIRKEMKLALMECGRKLGIYLRKRAKMKRESERRDVFERYIGEIAKAVSEVNGTDAKRLFEALRAQAKKHTMIADQQLDDEGRRIRDEDPADQDGVIIVDAAGAESPPGGGQTRAEAAALKVAAMAHDDAPALIDTREVPRSSAKGKAKKEPGKAPVRPRATMAEEPPAPAKPAVSKTGPKPKLRLINGKYVPVDEGPGLF
ncbi:MAG: DNA topoisomerase VI subunit B [Phycisphaerales bacterium]|nr:DNA topoisomerase VI subunit B [Phycisphaerales bacterium]